MTETQQEAAQSKGRHSWPKWEAQACDYRFLYTLRLPPQNFSLAYRGR